MDYRRSSLEHIEWTSRNFDFLVDAAASNGSTDVPACPGWTCLDVLEHTAKGAGVWAAGVGTGGAGAAGAGASAAGSGAAGVGEPDSNVRTASSS